MTDERRFLTMDDGVRIAVTLHLPDHEPAPWPVVFEARPYRKDDLSDATRLYRRLCDEGGLAVCRADVRGTGSSEGIALDEYTRREWDDWLFVIDWLSSQAWSNGNVGMFGTSYSGFNSLQVAAMRPPALKAIIPIYATDRRYTDDVHYGGGIRRGIDFLDYPMNMLAMNALPPVPSVYGEGWRHEWMRRIEANEPWELTWLEQQDEGEYWRHGSVWFDGYERIEAATMIIAGHADGYRNMAFRGFERLQCPKRLLFGPWSHMSPRLSMPGPRVDHVPEMISWWRRWLADEDNGVDREPPIQLFMRRATRPEPDLQDLRGGWRAEPAWPPERLHERVHELVDADRFAGGARTDAGDVLDVRGDVGVTGSIWCAADLPFGSPWDQRADEAFSLAYDVMQTAAELEIAGHPRVELRISSSTPVAFVSAKLCDVFPDGISALITRGILNLSHRDSHDHPAPLRPGEPVQVSLELDATAYIVEPGHRLRLDLAGADFPSSWPPPHAGTLTIDPAASRLVLPVLDGPPPEAEPPAFAAGVPAPHRPERVTWTIEDDVLARERRVQIEHGGVRGEAGDIRIVDTYGGEIGVSTVEPGRAWATGATSFELAFPEATVRAVSQGTLRTDRDTWQLTLELEVYEDDRQVAHRRWERAVPRGLH